MAFLDLSSPLHMNKWRFYGTLTHLVRSIHSRYCSWWHAYPWFSKSDISQYHGSTLPAATVFGCCSITWATFSSFLLSSRQIYIKDNNQRDSNLPQEQFQLMELCGGEIRAPKPSICKKPTGENITLIKCRVITGKPLNGFNVLVCMFWEPAISL